MRKYCVGFYPKKSSPLFIQHFPSPCVVWENVARPCALDGSLFGCHSRRTPWYLCFSAVHVTDWLWFACATSLQHLTRVQTLSYTDSGWLRCDMKIHVSNYNADYRPGECQGVVFCKTRLKNRLSRDENGKNLSHPKSWQKINKSKGLLGVVRKKRNLVF